MKIFNITAFVFFMAVVGILVYNLFLKEKSNFYTITRPSRTTIEKKLYIPGNVYPVKEVELKSHISGILEEIKVKIGDYVEAGTPIASVRLISGSSDIERLQSNLKLAKIEFEMRDKEFARNKQLFSTGVISRSDFEAALKIYLVSKEQLVTAQNQLSIIKAGTSSAKDISNIVKSSTNGVIIDIPIEEGTSVIERNSFNAGTTIATLADMSRFKFQAQISEQYLKEIESGEKIRLTFNAYDSLAVEATVLEISSKGMTYGNDAVKYSIEAEFDISPDMPAIRSGYSATAEVLLAKRKNVYSIEEKHIHFSNDSIFVYIMDSLRNKPVKKLIRIGISDDIYTEIVDGIGQSDKIITNYSE